MRADRYEDGIRRGGVGMLKKWLGMFLLLGIFLTAMPRGMAAAADEFEQAQLDYMSALAAMASYDDRLNLVVRSELEANGWTVRGFQLETDAADGRFFVVSHEGPGQPIYLLAVPGTEKKKDIQVDMRFSKVLFAGQDPASFAEAVSQQQTTSRDPLVHKGFEQYTHTAFFTPGESGIVPGQRIQQELLAAPGKKLYITGHSLGGAVAVLLAARLTAMGVPAKQLQVVTFGAPAVGNATFARQYGDALTVERIVMDRDPVNQLLQSISGGYAQFGKKVNWQRRDKAEHFEHYMVVYLDAALRNYYDVCWRLGKRREDAALLRGTPPCQTAVYVAPMNFSLDDEIRGDIPYMRAALQDMLAARIQRVVFGSGSRTSLAAACAEAKKQGCSYVLLEDFNGVRLKKERWNFRLTMEEMLYDTEGRLLTMQTNSVDTSSMTPIEAMLYNQIRGRESRETILMEKQR